MTKPASPPAAAPPAPPPARPGPPRPRVLCVDDEPHVVDGLALQLRRAYDVVGAGGGEEGLAALAAKGPFAIVLSDMRMPGMDGATFLARVRERAPDATRVLLTGHADLDAAMAAVNRGGIYRFLTKPCPPDELRLAMDAAAEQHRLVTAERELLEQTLRGSVRALADVLAITSPVAFGRATRVRRLALDLAARLGLADRWSLDVAATLSELGAITVPDDVLTRQQRGEALSREEVAMLGKMPGVVERLLGNVPRIDPVRALLALCGRAPPGFASRAACEAPGMALGASVLRLAGDFDELEARGTEATRVVEVLRGRAGRYEPAALAALAELRGAQHEELREVAARELTEGMILAEDVRTKAGVLLLARGLEVTESVLERLHNSGPGYVREPIVVRVRTSKKA